MTPPPSFLRLARPALNLISFLIKLLLVGISSCCKLLGFDRNFPLFILFATAWHAEIGRIIHFFHGENMKMYFAYFRKARIRTKENQVRFIRTPSAQGGDLLVRSQTPTLTNKLLTSWKIRFHDQKSAPVFIILVLFGALEALCHVWRGFLSLREEHTFDGSVLSLK